MPGFNYGAPTYAYGGYQPNNIWNNTGSMTWGNNGYQNTGFQNVGYQQNSQRDDHFQYVDYVSGRAGADAYQLPPNVNKAILYDNDTDRFYVKGYDENGRPRVLADNDFTPHVEPEPNHQNSQIDLSGYVTKADLEQMINNAVKSIQYPNLAGYVTQNDLDKALSGLSVGNGGRIVRINESNA